MKLGRQHALLAFVAIVLGAGGLWLARHTEWVEVQVPNPTKGEALRDADYRLKQLATRLGAKVSAPANLAELPPPGATLVLNSTQWNLFPERAQALRRWVEAGGHLWLPYRYQGEVDAAMAWVPVKWVRIAKPKPPSQLPPRAAAQASAPGADDEDEDREDDDDDDDGDDSPAPAAAVPPSAPRSSGKPRCPGVGEPAHVTPVFGAPHLFEACLFMREKLRTRVPVQWALYGPHGQVVARVPVGRGSVTVASAHMPWDNSQLLLSDNALLAAATLRIQPGQTLWFVRDETRPPLLAFLWRAGAPAVCLGALALALALWRGAVRFGPRAAVLPTVRRSMVEQIRGTAHFIRHHGSTALHAAQLRALHDVARPRIHGFDKLIVGERAQAIATLTSLDTHALALAMNPALSAALSRHPGAALALIETARRRLLLNTTALPRTDIA